MAPAQVFPLPTTTLDAQARRGFFAEYGFLQVPRVLDPDALRRVRAAVTDLGAWHEDPWHRPELVAAIAQPTLIAAIEQLLGPDLRFFKGVYVRTPPLGSPGERPLRQGLHRDYGIGEEQGDFRNSNACWLNVGIYLDDLTPERGPLWVVPGSHRLTHLAPGGDYSGLDHQARMVLARAGDAVLFASQTVHAGGANRTAWSRAGLFYSYRAAWARPIGQVREWPEALVGQLPPRGQALLRGQNDGMARSPVAEPAYA